MPLGPGLEAHVEHTVTDRDTATAHGSGDVDVLATPALVALCERAAVEAVAPELENGQTTVGAHVALDHLAPTRLGESVVVRASLKSVEGRRLTFSVEASDPRGTVGRGTHVRVLVDRGRFLDRVGT